MLFRSGVVQSVAINDNLQIYAYIVDPQKVQIYNAQGALTGQFILNNSTETITGITFDSLNQLILTTDNNSLITLSPTACPDNSSVDGTTGYCACNPTFALINDTCLCAPPLYLDGALCTCPDNSTLDNTTGSCACNPTFTYVDNACVCAPPLILDGTFCNCPANSTKDNTTGECTCNPTFSLIDGTCVCAAPFQFDGSSCVCPANSTKNEITGSCICNATFTLIDSTCMCSAPLYLDGASCACEDGNYYVSETECAECNIMCYRCSGEGVRNCDSYSALFVIIIILSVLIVAGLFIFYYLRSRKGKTKLSEMQKSSSYKKKSVSSDALAERLVENGNEERMRL